jgi:hypothetical protein
MAQDKPRNPMPREGEGDHASARKFDQAQSQFAKSGKVKGAARAAEKALDGPEGASLEAARRASAKGESVGKRG